MTVDGHYQVEERALAPQDITNGVLRRWMVTTPFFGFARLVVQMKPPVSRFAPEWACSCAPGVGGCDHIRAVQASLPQPPRAA